MTNKMLMIVTSLAIVVLPSYFASAETLFGAKIGNFYDTDFNAYHDFGVKLGFTASELVEIAADYTYVDRPVDKNILGVSASLVAPIPVIAPYVTIGAELFPFEKNLMGGIGIKIMPPFIDVLSLDVGIAYHYLFDNDSWLETVLGLNLKI